jgi:hypothetical protein
MGEVSNAKIHLEENISYVAPASTSNQNNLSLNDLIKDKYGNYVIQRVLELTTEQQRTLLIDKIYKYG